MLDPLADQLLALATEATAVLFLGGRRFHHRAHPRFAALVCQQRANQRTREPLCYCRLIRPVDRPCARSPPAERHWARYGFEREPDPWRAGDERLERALRLHLLSS